MNSSNMELTSCCVEKVINRKCFLRGERDSALFFPDIMKFFRCRRAARRDISTSYKKKTQGTSETTAGHPREMCPGALQTAVYPKDFYATETEYQRKLLGSA